LLAAACTRTAPSLPSIPTDDLTPTAREALESARRAADKNPGLYGQLLHAYGLYEYALDPYQRAESADPKNADWPYYQALVLEKLGKPDAAREKLRRALEVKPDLVPAEMRMGEALLAAGQSREALDYLTRAAAQEPRNPRAQFLLGRARQALYDLPGAINAWLEAVRLAPNYGSAHTALAEAYRSLNQERLARLHADEAAAPGVADPADEYEVRLRYLKR
jgi:tetratricopeptide (TPR) repeat protein